MKKLAVFPFLLFTLSVFSQSFLKRATELDLVQVGLSFSPDYSYRVIALQENEPNSKRLRDWRDDRESAVFGYTTGLSCQLNLFERFGIAAGIQYSQKGYQSEWREVSPLEPDPAIPLKVEQYHKFEYIEVPVTARYRLLLGRLHFVTSLGASLGVLVSSSSTMEITYADGEASTSNTESTNTEAVRTINLAPIASLGAEYEISNHIELRMEPTFRYSITGLTDAPLADRLWSAGINVGLWFSL